MNAFQSCVLVVLLCLRYFWETEAFNEGRFVNVVILGATGSLAKKHLWKSLFRLRQDQPELDFYYYGSGRRNKTIGEPILLENLNNIDCEDQHCVLHRHEFIKRVKYIQLKTESDYQHFCHELNSSSRPKTNKENNYCPKNGCYLLENRELGRLFYIAVPPFDYNIVSININKHCRPEKPTWFRIAFEKPFGHDFNSMKNLSDFLLSLFTEDELYRVDHYLGKKAVRDILLFRFQNLNPLDTLWTKDYIDHIEIALKEKEDVKGRISYYDKYGVILDVMQNHLTETLLLLMMELPSDINSNSQIHDKKVLLLKELRSPGSRGILVGQYDAYIQHRKEELSDSSSSTTPTFSSVVLHVDNCRWASVPVVLTAGKDLKEKSVYAKVVFKTHFHVMESVSSSRNPEIWFIIHSDQFLHPAILVSKNLMNFTFSVPQGWTRLDSPDAKTSFGKYMLDYDVFVSDYIEDAYKLIMSDLLLGKMSNFISSDHLMLSWKLWSDVLYNSRHLPLQYYSQHRLQSLDFMLNEQELRYIHQTNNFKSQNEQKLLKGSFRSSDLLWGTDTELAEVLASFIRKEAENSIHARGVFHLALCGGSSVVPLLLILAHKNPSFPWHATHIWMTDERCVPKESEYSNFNSLEQNLLRFISVPYCNVHPMPVELARGLCVPEDKGTFWYEKQLRHLVPNMQLDFIVLGVGSDGHVASIFSLQSPDEKHVVLTVSPAAPVSRMTLSMNMLNNASFIALLAFGIKKRNIIQKLANEESSELPVTLVKPRNKLMWFLDRSAYPDRK